MTEIQDFWDKQANCGDSAGTQDLVAKELEMKALSSYISDGLDILDFGCGNGITAIKLAQNFDVNILGIDFSNVMIAEANKSLAGKNLKGTISFQVGDTTTLKTHDKKYDCIYTERMIINLLNWTAQKEAIRLLFSLLKPEGRYLMCENSQDGLNTINQFRDKLGLPKIIPPWHNRYLNDSDFDNFFHPGICLETINHYSSTYYFISRVVNAWQAKQAGEEPKYDAPANKLALSLPSMGSFGQGRIWVWKKLTYEERVKIVKKVEEAYRHRTLV